MRETMKKPSITSHTACCSESYQIKLQWWRRKDNNITIMMIIVGRSWDQLRHSYELIIRQKFDQRLSLWLFSLYNCITITTRTRRRCDQRWWSSAHARVYSNGSPIFWSDSFNMDRAVIHWHFLHLISFSFLTSQEIPLRLLSLTTLRSYCSCMLRFLEWIVTEFFIDCPLILNWTPYPKWTPAGHLLKND